MSISVSKLTPKIRKSSVEDKQVYQKQFNAWRKSKNASVLFHKETEDSFYNHNLSSK